MRPLSLACYFADSCNAVNSVVRKPLVEQDAEAVLQRLDRLAQQEARMTLLQILEVTYSLVQNTRVVMDGKQNALAFITHKPLSMFLFRP